MNAAHRLGAELGHHTHTGPRISFFSDNSVAVVKKQKVFHDVREQLKKMNIDHALIYPVMPKMKVNGTEKRFDIPEGAIAFLDLVKIYNTGQISLFLLCFDNWTGTM